MTSNLISSLTTIVCISISLPSALNTNVAQFSAGRALIGEVTSIDMNSKVLLIKTDDGSEITLSFAPGARLLKVRAGDTSLSASSEITLSGISVGDRVSGRGLLASDKSRLWADTVIVMSRSDIQKKQEQQEMEWATRSIAGVVRELKPESSEIILDAYGPAAAARIVVQTTACKFRRYSSVSARFSDTTPGAFSDLKAGDQLRALGTRSADGLTWLASEIVSGSFQTFGGTVTSLDQQNSEIKILTLGQKREVIIQITRDSIIKRISPQAAMALAQKALGLRSGPPVPAAV